MFVSFICEKNVWRGLLIAFSPHLSSLLLKLFSEYRLSEDANPDRAMLVGFELLLARVEYYHLLDTDQLKPQVR